jgi:uncharacterized membrane protein YuzA (DUF378 family)
MKGLMKLAWVLLVIGGLNWGLIGFFGYDIVARIFGSGSTLTKVIYDLVGLSALYLVLGGKKM